MDKKESWLEDYKRREDQLSFPKDLDRRITAGMLQAKEIKKKKWRKMQWLTASFASISVASILLFGGMSLLSENDNVPGWLSNALSKIGFTEREKTFHENTKEENAEYIGYAKQLDQTIKHGNISVTVYQVVASQEGIRIDYRVKVDDPNATRLYITDEDIVGEDGNSLKQVEHLESGMIELPEKSFKDTYTSFTFPHLQKDQLLAYGDNWTYKIVFERLQDTPFEFDIPIDRSWFDSEVIELDKTVGIDGNMITIHDVTISPLFTKIGFSLHPDTIDNVLGIEKPVLRNENGITWGKADSYNVVNIGRERTEVIFTNDFQKIPEELSLQFSNLHVLDKGTSKVEIDIKDYAFHQIPEGIQVPSMMSNEREDKVTFEFIVNGYIEEDGFFPDYFIDATGNKGTINVIESKHQESLNETSFTVEFSPRTLSGPISFDVNYAIKKLASKVKIPIK
ncbi:hypothetical protein HNQ94_003335 [Salirhabdus euzebyi]|uniref:DUF4179 domain-containing protein n=1 Tax=Salirhabdus euzebyi TaxID=394506 RepID=A0A841Q8X8_9BACI|nr:hypothetical protein [Salirhabdus euzebyi]MBB6454846.1 hypothetical protein [Salirhabdus euzebyi]